MICDTLSLSIIQFWLSKSSQWTIPVALKSRDLDAPLVRRVLPVENLFCSTIHYFHPTLFCMPVTINHSVSSLRFLKYFVNHLTDKLNRHLLRGGPAAPGFSPSPLEVYSLFMLITRDSNHHVTNF